MCQTVAMRWRHGRFGIVPQFRVLILLTSLHTKQQEVIMYTATVAALAALPLASAFVAPTGFTGNALARYKIQIPLLALDHV
jgi:hypothetical protein